MYLFVWSRFINGVSLASWLISYVHVSCTNRNKELYLAPHTIPYHFMYLFIYLFIYSFAYLHTSTHCFGNLDDTLHIYHTHTWYAYIHTHTHKQTNSCTHACVCMVSRCLSVYFYIFLLCFVTSHVCVCVCVCMYVSRRQGGQTRRYKDALKQAFCACNIATTGWEGLTANRTAWRQATIQGVKAFEESRLEQLDTKRLARKERRANPAAAVVCPVCGRDCASAFGLRSHLRRHWHHCRLATDFHDGMYVYVCVCVWQVHKFMRTMTGVCSAFCLFVCTCVCLCDRYTTKNYNWCVCVCFSVYVLSLCVCECARMCVFLCVFTYANIHLWLL